MDDREVELDLVDPGGVDGEVDQAGVRPGLLDPPNRGLACVGAAVVNDPVHRARGGVRLDGHHLFDEPAERFDPVGGLDAVEQVGVVDVPSGEVGEGAVAFVLELDPGRPPGLRRQCRMATPERLQLGLLVGADHVLVGP